MCCQVGVHVCNATKLRQWDGDGQAFAQIEAHCEWLILFGTLLDVQTMEVDVVCNLLGCDVIFDLEVNHLQLFAANPANVKPLMGRSEALEERPFY
jgi:hypothetical protein